MKKAMSNSGKSDDSDGKSQKKLIAHSHLSFVKNLTPYSYAGARS